MLKIPVERSREIMTIAEQLIAEQLIKEGM